MIKSILITTMESIDTGLWREETKVGVISFIQMSFIGEVVSGFERPGFSSQMGAGPVE